MRKPNLGDVVRVKTSDGFYMDVVVVFYSLDQREVTIKCDFPEYNDEKGFRTLYTSALINCIA